MKHYDVWERHNKFLLGVVSIIRKRKQYGWHRSQSLAMNVIRTVYDQIFGGVGVYTVTEAFHLAG